MRLFQNPIIGMIGSAAGVIGLILTIYFAHQSTKRRNLVFYVNPAQAVVVKTGEASRLRVLYGNEELTSDVTAAQVAIWNDGNESIRPENILQEIMIRTVPAVPILEATVRKTSRPVVSFALDHSQFAHGELGVSWNILEHDDGAVIQLVYAGPPTTKIEASGVVEGQQNIDHPHGWGTKPSEDDQKLYTPTLKLMAWTMIVLGAMMALSVSIRFVRTGRLPVLPTRSFPGFMVRSVFVVGPLFYIGMGLFLLFKLPPTPPFGF